MPNATVQDYRGGVDRRSPQSSGTPGTLWSLENAHITRGGRIEKRKKVVQKFTLTPGKTWGMKGCKLQPHVFGYQDPSTFVPPIPAGVVYEQLTHPSDPAIAIQDVLDVLTFNAKNYVFVKFVDGSIHHYYDAKRVTAWDDGVMTSWRTTLPVMASHLADLLNADLNFKATASGNTITLQSRKNATSTAVITALAENVKGGVNDQKASVFDIQAPTVDTPETLSSGTFTLSTGTAGQSVTSVRVGGVEILGAPVAWQVSDAYTAGLVAAQICGYISTPEYTAIVSAGAQVKIIAAAGTGTGPNGLVVAVTGTVTSTVNSSMAGGVALVPGRPQISIVVLSGTAETGDRFAISIDTLEYGAGNNPLTIAKFGVGFGQKIYAVAGSVCYFCSVSNPMIWRANVVGAGFINIQSSGKGSEDVLAVVSFLTGLAFLSSSYIQQWAIADNPASNALLHELPNTGGIAAHAVVGAGNVDTFYLSASGIRSLRQQMYTGAPLSADVGDAIDAILQPLLSTLTPVQLVNAKAAVNPFDARVWFWLGTTVYVLSYYPQSKISAWSWYNVGMEPGWMDAIVSRLYIRSGDAIYVYGGDDGQTYDSSATDQYNVLAEMPFLNTGRIAADKIATAYNVGAQGAWTIYMKSDPQNTAVEDVWGQINGFNYAEPEYSAALETTHFAPRLVSTAPGPALISEMSFDFENIK